MAAHGEYRSTHRVRTGSRKRPKADKLIFTESNRGPFFDQVVDRVVVGARQAALLRTQKGPTMNNHGRSI
jgi:hypothetical protein